MLQFVGATGCIFPDHLLKKLQRAMKTPIESVGLPHQTQLKIFKEFDPTDYLIIGVDTASSTEGAYNAVEIFGVRNFDQYAELNVKLGSLTKYGEIVDAIFKYTNSYMGGRVLIAVENNSIGKAIIEHLQFHVKKFNYLPFLYFEPEKIDRAGNVKEYGIHTSGTTKERMVSFFYEMISENSTHIYSEDLITQLHGITRNNSGNLSHTAYSD